MNITLVTETYPPEVNGVAMTLSRLVEGLVQRGHRLEVIRPRQSGEGGKQGPCARGVAEWTVPGMPIPFYRSLRVGLPVWGMLESHWREVRPDVVHIATEGPLGLAALRAAQATGLLLTSSFHTNFHQYGRHYGLNLMRHGALRYLRWFHNRTLCTMVPTGELRARLARLKFSNLAVLSRGVDGELYTPEKRQTELRASWGAGPDTPVFIYVGRLAAEKNLGLAVRAFLAIKTRHPDARFVLVGEGPERRVLEQKYPELHFAGVRRGHDLAAHYASADVFLFPSLTETFGNVVTEAMASGLVGLAYDYAAAREYMRDGISGVLVPFGRADDFVALAEGLCARRALWPAWRREARATALNVTWDRVVAQFEQQLRQAREQASGP